MKGTAHSSCSGQSFTCYSCSLFLFHFCPIWAVWLLLCWTYPPINVLWKPVSLTGGPSGRLWWKRGLVSVMSFLLLPSRHVGQWQCRMMKARWGEKTGVQLIDTEGAEGLELSSTGAVKIRCLLCKYSFGGKMHLFMVISLLFFAILTFNQTHLFLPPLFFLFVWPSNSFICPLWSSYQLFDWLFMAT